MMARNYKLPPLGRAYDWNTGKLVQNVTELHNPQGGGNPELMRQWHLKHLGDIGTIWNDYTGKGVSVGVYDSGVQKSHWDLAANYDSSKHVVVDGKVIDGEPNADPTDGTSFHGTAVAGLIGAARNGRGGVGVAYDVNLTGVNIFDPALPSFVNGGNLPALENALMQANQFDVVNHSWGALAGNGTSESRSNPASFSSFLAGTFEYAAVTGRNGLGTVSLMAAGNSGVVGEIAVGSPDRHAIAVGAYREVDGAASNYSNSGAHLLISAPSNDYAILGGTGLVTTDLLGTRGYNWSEDPQAPNDYTNSFGGTSGATPIVSGVVALMLDANEDLGWRDVQNILAASAKMPVEFDVKQVALSVMQNGVRTNAALNEGGFNLGGGESAWNGGRMHFSNDYGYGAVDAYNATRMAEVWGLFAGAKTSANEVHETLSVDVGLTAIGTPEARLNKFDQEGDISGTIFKKTFQVDNDVQVEHLDLTVFYKNIADVILGDASLRNYAELSLVQIKLTAPDGTTAFTSLDLNAQWFSTEQNEFTFGFAGLRGVNSKGQWTFEFNVRGLDEQIGAPGSLEAVRVLVTNNTTIDSLKLDIYGSIPTNDDVHTYTNEFFTMLDIDGEGQRKTLVDTDGGTDWINAAAVSSDIKLSLVAGQSTTFAGEKAFMIGRTSLIENAVTGDGNDTLIGNRFDNFLVGMRGNDTLNGGAGNDWLIGGTGNDRFLFDNRGTSGKDLVLDLNRGDLIGTQTALRGAGADGKITVAASTLLLLDGTRTGDTAQLSEQGGAVVQGIGEKDGYFWYAFVSGTDIKMGDVIREAGASPTDAAAGTLAALSAMAANDVSLHGGTVAALTGPDDQSGAFYLYDAMGGSMSMGVQLYA